MLWSSDSSSFAGVFLSAARPVRQQESALSRSERLVEMTGKPFVLILNPVWRDGRVGNADGWMREEEEETLSDEWACGEQTSDVWMARDSSENPRHLRAPALTAGGGEL